MNRDVRRSRWPGSDAFRSWAANYPNSFFDGKDVPLVKKARESDMLDTALHKRESMYWVMAAALMVIVSAEDAKKMKRPVAHKLG